MAPGCLRACPFSGAEDPYLLGLEAWFGAPCRCVIWFFDAEQPPREHMKLETTGQKQSRLSAPAMQHFIGVCDSIRCYRQPMTCQSIQARPRCCCSRRGRKMQTMPAGHYANCKFLMLLICSHRMRVSATDAAPQSQSTSNYLLLWPGHPLLLWGGSWLMEHLTS